MKKILTAALAGVVFICASCNDAGNTGNKESTAQQKNIAASDAIDKAFKTGDVSVIDSVVSEGYIDHTDQGDKKGRDSLKAMVNIMHTNFKDMKLEKIRQIADEEYVFSWMRYSGTSDGSMGMPKGPYTMTSVEVSKYKDGKTIEHWTYMDMKEMMKMMPQANMGTMSNMDTTKAK